tara:strand:- start:1170 stop:1274 length:105 start_codon:yes stop_codon:yes gene_type:complete
MAREMNIGTSAPKAGALPLGDAPKFYLILKTFNY